VPLKRALVVLVIASAAAVAARVAAPGPQNVSAAVARQLACGVERWNIKTLKDRPLLLPARAATVAQLTSLPRPAYLPPNRRLPIERRIYSVIAAVTIDRTETDLDHHLVLRSGSHTMIAETPSAFCMAGATAVRRTQMVAGGKGAKVCARARVVGVAFFDYKHGQTGVAPNAIELHPVLGFACLSGGGPPPPPPPPPGGKCAPSYPGVCIRPPPPDLNCADISYRNFRVRWDVPNPDPHHFDGNHNGIGCET
jgi:hypothetical protein